VPTVNFIDYEYGDYNYREYDIANHFNEFVGMGDENGNLDYEKFYPSKDFQILWINEYIEQFNYCKGNNDDPAKQKVILIG
jgi:thiamine kinase-like enzyme